MGHQRSSEGQLLCVNQYMERTRDYKTNRFEQPAEVDARVQDRWGISFDMFEYGEVGSER
ncbi:hypothetical protein [Aeoliella sp.]|uniref:hypothetical protein n=1 Tax=Aeoliella sp. TaxID=2795800 RepID=UPI003CCBFCF3